MFELMTSVAVLGLLAAVAIPSYEHYTVRSKIAEGLAMATSVRVAVAETRLSDGDFRLGSHASYGLPVGSSLSGNPVASIDVREQGIIAIAYRGDTAYAGREVHLRPEVVGGSVRWNCSGGNLPSRYRPGNCRG